MKIKACLKIAILFLLFLLPFTSKAQLDLIHYVPPLYAGTTNESDIEDHWVVLTTPSENLIEITIKRGDGTIFKKVSGVSINNPVKVPLNEGYKGTLTNTPLGVVNYTSLNKPIKDQGLIFTSTEAFYVNIRHKSEIHGLSLTAKGQAGLGTSFRSGHLHSVRGENIKGWGPYVKYGWTYYNYSIVDHRSHFISVMATEDNTVVTFSDIKVGNLTSDSRTALPVSDITTDVNTANSVFDFTDDGVFNVVLNEGESYVLGANHEFLTPDDVNKFNGTKISSDKPIAVNSGSWCGSASTSNKQDIGVDQIVPEKLVGNEYILIKGQGDDGSECPVVVATKDGTNITVNGISGIINPTPLNAGDSYPIESKHFDRDEGTMLINTNHNVYVYQTTAASKDKPYPTIGMNFIPPLSSLGFRQVDIPFINELGTGIVAIYSQKGADVFVNNSKTPLDQASAKLVKGKDEWVVYEYSTSDENVSVMSDKAIYVALSVFDNVVGAAGYFSGFTKSISPINPEVVFNYDLGYICSNKEGYLDLKINSTPNPDWYEWYHDIIHPDSIKNPNENLFVPVPKKATKYILKAYFRDPNMDILYNGDFAIGRGRFESDFDFNYISRLEDPGKAVLCANPQSVNTSFSNFEDVHDELSPEGKMLLAHSSGSGNADVLWKKTLTSSIDIPDNLFILKFYGRLAHKVDDKYSDQYLDVFVNDEKVYSNFQLNDTEAWKSVKAFWRAGKAESATIKIVDANASGKQSIFAIDSISFVPAVEAVKEFNPDVVPSYSYTPYDKGLHFCKGAEQAVANIKHGDMEWFTFLWEKKLPDNTFAPITDSSIEGLDTYELKFNNVVDDHAGIYRCTIDFKETYEQCGIDVEPTSVEVEVFIDEPAGLEPLVGKTEYCEGVSTDISANVSGDFSVIKWSVSKKEGGEVIYSYSGSENVFKFNSELNYPAGEYIVRCEVINGCSEDLTEEIIIKILGKAKLKSLITPTYLCEIKEITLEAKLDGDYILDNSTIEYSWYKNGESSAMGTSNVPAYKLTPDMNDKSYKVLVNTHYNFGPTNQFTCEGNFIEENLATNPVHPEIKLIGLNSDPVCEGEPYTYKAELETPSLTYAYKWDVPDGAKEGKTPEDFKSSSFSLASVKPEMVGDYKITVTNNCGNKNAISSLVLKPRLLVTGISLSKDGPYCLDDHVTVTVEDNGNASGYIAENLTTGEIRNDADNPFTIQVDASTEGQWQVTAKSLCGDKKTSIFPIYLADSFSTPTIAPRKSCLGGKVTLVAVVETQPVGTSLRYQWKDQLGIEIPGENSSSLEISDIKLADAGEYTCVVSDGICSTQEAKGTLSVDDITIESLKPESVSKCQGETFRFDIPFVGKPTFAWFYTGADDIKKNLNVSTSFYETPLLAIDDAGMYSCEITTSCGLKVFKQTLNVLTNVTVTKDPSVVTDICEGEYTTLILNLTGSYESIKWYKEGSELTGELDKRVISTGELETSGTFRYKYIVEGSCGDVEGTFNVVVHERPVLSALDNNVEECAGIVTLNITESGEHNGISWWKNDVEITDGNAEPTNYVIDPATSPASDGNYIAKVNSNFCGENQVSISVDITNNIVVTDKSDAVTTICEDGTVSLFVDANAGGDRIHYKWTQTSKPAKIFPNTPSIELKDIIIDEDAGEYTCEISNDLGCGNTLLIFNVVVNKNPKITKDPDNQIICETEVSVDFTVAGDVQGDIHYQWYDKDDVAVGTDHPTLTVVPVDGQSYYCKIWGDACGEATTQTATLTIIPKVAVSNPEDVTINDGADATFSVVASGEKEYSWQWEIWNGSDWESVAGAKYSGINSEVLKITNALKADFDGNQYRCVVTSDGAICNLNATATSDEAKLTINSVNKIVSTGQPENQIVCEEENFTFSITGTKTTGLTYQWQYHEGDNNFKNTKLDTDVEVSTYTISNAKQDMETWEFRCLVSDGVSTPQPSNEVTVDVWENIVVATPSVNNLTLCEDAPLSLSVDVTAGEKVKFAWTKTKDKDGTPTGDVTVLQTGSVLNLGSVELSEAGTYNCNIYNEQGCGDTGIVFNVTVQENAKVTLQPIDKAICESDVPVLFDADGTAEGDEKFEWFDKDGTSVGTNKILTINLPENGQSYYCIVSGDACKTATTDVANLTVYEEVVITDPSDQTASDGKSVTFTVSATGEPTIEYKWYEKTPTGNWTTLTDDGTYSGVGTASLTIDPVFLGMDANQYKCEAWSTTCSAVDESAAAILEILDVNKISVQVENQVVCQGEDVVFSITGTEATGLTYQWQYHTGDNNFTDVYVESDVLVSTYTISKATQDMENWGFRCIVKDGSSSDQPSNDVSVDIWENIAVSNASPTSIDVCEDLPLSLSVDVTLGDHVKFAWTKTKYKDGTPTGDASVLQTGSVLNLGSADLSEGGTYNCKVYNDKGCGDTDIVFNVTVQENAKVTLQPIDKAICESDVPVLFEADGTAEGDEKYEWFDKEGILVGTDKILTINIPENGQSYYCVVSGDACATATTNVANLTVYEEVEITDPADQTAYDGENAIFTVGAVGEPTIEYKWYEKTPTGVWTPLVEGVNYSGVSTKELTVNTVSLSMDAYKYKCEAWSTTCSAVAESAVATLTVIPLNKILTHPKNTQSCKNDEIKFEITGTEAGYTYEWQYNEGGGFVSAVGNHSMTAAIDGTGKISTLIVPTAAIAMNSWKFQCVVKYGSSEDVTSNEVTLKVFEPIEITPIDNQELCFEESKQITLDVTSGTEPYTYSWTKDATEVSATTIVNIGGADNGNYKVIASNGGVCPDKSSEFTVIHHSKLSLDAWENADHVCIGTPETLSVSIDNVDPALTLSYKWYKDGDEIVGETSANYILTAADKSKAGQYKVEVFDGCSTEFVSGYVDVYQSIVPVSIWPAEKTLCLGEELNLEAIVSGDNPTYKWTLPITSTRTTSIGSIFKIDEVALTDAGTYICEIKGTCGDLVRYEVNVVVNNVPVINEGLDGLYELCEGEALTLGEIKYEATVVDNIHWILADGSVKDGLALNSIDLTSVDIDNNEGNYRVEVSNVCGSDFSLGFVDVHPIPTLDPIDDQIACQGENVIFRAETTGENLPYRWFVNGKLEEKYNDKDELVILNVQPEDEYTAGTYKVECQVSSCGTDLNEFAEVTVNPNTILNSSLKGEVVYVGKDHVFNLNVTGSNLKFEWHHINTAGDDNPIVSANTKTLKIDNLSMSDAGEYYCVITGDCGVRFTSGYLTVKDPMKIVEGLTETNIEKCFGEPLNLNISVEGEVFSINWFKGDENLGHHGLSYSIPSLDISDTGLYRCVIVGEGSGFEESVDVKVNKTTVLNSVLNDKVLCEKEDLSWIPDVSGSVLSYNWQYGGKTVSTESTFSIADLTLGASGKYSVDITGKCGSVKTEANLLVKKLPEFISKSDDLERCENDPEALFVVEFLGDNLVYQWQKDNVDIPGANSTELRLQNLRTSDAASYKCIVNSSCGVATESPEMKLVVIPQLKVLSESPGMEICDGDNAQFLVEVKGTDETYQWQKDGVDIPGEKAPQLMIDPASLTEEGYYNCEITDKCTKGVKRYSNAKKLTVNALPNSKIFGRMTLCVLEDRVAYNTTIQPDVNYGWLVDGGEFTSATEGLRTKITWGDVIEDGKVKLKILNESTGCYSQVDSLVKLRPLPDVKLAAQETKGICNPEFELKGGFPEGGIYWVNGVAQNTFDPGQGNGEYQVRYSYTDDLGCSNSTGEIIMIIDSLPEVKLIEDVIVGSCGSTILNANTEENNIKWAPGRYLDDPNSKTPTFKAGETTLYVATVVDKFGCVGNDIVNVTVAPLPIITTINDTIIGECKEIELTTHISGDVEEINWTNSDDLDNSKNSNPKLIKRRLGVNDYQINVTDEYGCIGSASIKVEVLPNPVVGENQFLCEGETLLVDTKDLSSPVWEDGYTAWERTIDKPGEYKLSVEQNDCKLEQKIVMNPLPKFELDNTVQPGIVIFEGETLILDPDLDPDYGPYVYDWSDGSVLPQLEVIESGTYKLSVEDNIGCIAKDSVVVQVKPIGIESPNAFTPLSNNENDRFYLKDINVIDKFEMYVYNRWGELLYKTNEPGYASGWDGTYRGEDCPVGAYVWVVMLDGEIKEKGTVILVR